MVAGFSDALRTNHFDSALDQEQTLMRYGHRYITTLPQSALRSRTPMQAMKDWHKSHPAPLRQNAPQSSGTR